MAGISLLANGTVTIDNRGSDVVSGQILPTVAIYPGSLRAASLSGDLIFTPDRTTTSAASLINLIPSRFGQMSLFAGGDIKPLTLVMEDRDPGQLPGIFSAFEPFPATNQILAGQIGRASCRARVGHDG